MPDVPQAAPACVQDQGSWCQHMYDWTGNDTLAWAAGPAISGAIRIALILAVAYLLRLFLHRLIRRFTRVTGDGAPALLRPLRERAPERFRDQAGTLRERRRQRAQTIGSALRSLTSVVVYGIAAVLCLDVLGVNLAPILASAGVVGVALGFGAQSLVKDFLSGMFMLLEDQYGVGDWVDLGEATGEVEAVGMRVTTVRDLAGTVWYVRNGEILRVGNSNQGHAVAVVDTPVAHTADIDRAIALAAEAANSVVSKPRYAGDVLGKPEMMGVQEVNPYAVTLRLLVKTKAGQQWAIRRAIAARIKTAFSAAGVPPPFPPTRAIPAEQGG